MSLCESIGQLAGRIRAYNEPRSSLGIPWKSGVDTSLDMIEIKSEFGDEKVTVLGIPVANIYLWMSSRQVTELPRFASVLTLHQTSRYSEKRLNQGQYAKANLFMLIYILLFSSE